MARVLVQDPDGIDTTLLQFRALSGDRERTERMVEDIDGLWFGDDDAIAMTSQDIITLTASDEITDRQTEAILTTIAAALGILMIFFWMTLRQPVLGFIAVGPIVLVLIWVLGTMTLLGIPYTIITSITTALSIGIGVDYTIHMIHRYREHFAKQRNPETAAIQHARHHRLGSARLSADDSARVRGADAVTAAIIRAVRHHGGDHDHLRADRLHPGRAARHDGLGRLPEHADALDGGAHVERSRHRHRGHAPAPPARPELVIERYPKAGRPEAADPDGMACDGGIPAAAATAGWGWSAATAAERASYRRRRGAAFRASVAALCEFLDVSLSHSGPP